MAFKLNSVHGYGSGINSTAENPVGQLCSYANVTDYTENTITIGTPANGAFEKFEANREIMIHVSATNGTSQEFKYLGRYLVATITSVASNVLTISDNFTKVLPKEEFSKYKVQVVTANTYYNLTLTNGTKIAPLVYHATKFYGGILFIKVNGYCLFSGGHIDLADKGIPVANKAMRPITNQETNGTLDSDMYAGWENSETRDRFLLNSGDGALFLVAKSLVCSAETSRIGNTTVQGVQYCRGASDSKGYNESKPANATNVGGSTIAIIADEIVGFNPKIISKYHVGAAGQGLARCYIATNSILPNDEGLYSYDIMSNDKRPLRVLNLHNFGTGSFGDYTNPIVKLNSYLHVTAVSSDGRTLTYNNKDNSGVARFEKGALVMYHIAKAPATASNFYGKFKFAHIVSDNGIQILLDAPVVELVPNNGSLVNMSVQLIAVPQYNNLTISYDFDKTPAYNTTTGTGGVCVVSVADTLDLSGGGYIDVEKKGGGDAYARDGLKYIGNAQDADILPIGQGHGSVLVIAKKIKLSSQSRIGARYDGAGFGGIGAKRGGKAGGYLGIGNGGSGADGGAPYQGSGYYGGYGSNSYGNGTNGSVRGNSVPANDDAKTQGAHVMIIADKMEGFSLSNLSTGGAAGSAIKSTAISGMPGGAGYGGGGTGAGNGAGCGGYNGGGGGGQYGMPGGSSGWAFIYCNNNSDPYEMFTGVRV